MWRHLTDTLTPKQIQFDAKLGLISMLHVAAGQPYLAKTAGSYSCSACKYGYGYGYGTATGTSIRYSYCAHTEVLVQVLELALIHCQSERANKCF